MPAVQRPLRISPMIWRTDALSLESIGQISFANWLLRTNSAQRGCVSQMMCADGNDSRRPATAGNVCTISPSEPRRTTRKRCSAMRGLADGINQRARGVFFGITNDGNANAQSRGRCALRDGFRGVIRAFGMNIRPQFREKRLDVGLAEEHDVIDVSNRSDEKGARTLIQYRPAGAFQVFHAVIRVHAHNQNVSFVFCAGEITRVPDVQRIKAAVGKNDLLAFALGGRAKIREFGALFNFGFGVAHGLGGRLRGGLLYRVEEFFVRDRGRAPLHNHETAGNICEERSFDRLGAAGKSEGIRGENGVTGTGNINGLVAAMNRNVDRL